MPDTWDATSRDYIEGRENEIVDNHAQYVSIVRTGIGNTTLVIGGEVDAGTTVLPFLILQMLTVLISLGHQA
jgi:RAT1-interacting protein